MWFESASEIAEIAARTSASIFVLPDEISLNIPNAIIISPDEKSVISVEQIRNITTSLDLKQYTDRYVIIRPADKLSSIAANAFLKNLEEPTNKVHYLLVTNQPASLLPTILSRAAIYYWRKTAQFTTEITASEAKITQAKRLISANPTELVNIAESLAKRKDKKSAALELLALSIEILYKSYFLTGKEIFLHKLPKYLKAYDQINQNGHVKLQLVANLC